jgi:nitrite transporter
MNGDAGWGDLFHNLLLTIPGNVVGGALIVGLPYAFGAPSRRMTASTSLATQAETVEPALV